MPAIKAPIKPLIAAVIVLVATPSAVRDQPQTRDANRCDGASIPLLGAAGSTLPYVTLSADGRLGAFQLDYGATASSLSAREFSAVGGDHVVENFSLPTFSSGRFVLRSYRSGAATASGKLGIVGTDFLSLLTADFSFRGDGGDVVLGDRACDPQRLHQRGMIGISQSGFFSIDPKRVRSDLPNVPVLNVRIGPVTVWAQIDTGYDDGVFPPSIDINDALYERLQTAGVELKPASGVNVVTCAGMEARAAFHVGDGVALVAGDGNVITELEGATLIRKSVGPCGGIGSFAEPAAQLGISALRRLGAIVIDPRAEMVWVAQQRP